MSLKREASDECILIQRASRAAAAAGRRGAKLSSEGGATT